MAVGGHRTRVWCDEEKKEKTLGKMKAALYGV